MNAVIANKNVKDFCNTVILPIAVLSMLISCKQTVTRPEQNPIPAETVTEPVATYQESDDLLQVLFPKNKTIFLMCQSGGRVAQLMTLLNAKGYDMSKIYNVGGMGQFTAPEYADYTVDALEFKVNATYAIEGLTRN